MNVEMNETVVLIVVLVVALALIYQPICGLVAATIASRKQRNNAEFFFLTLLMLGPLGVAVAILAAPGESEGG